jgi:hypothetical protein
MAQQVVKLKKEHKRHMAMLYKGNMPKLVRVELGSPEKERAMMLTDVKPRLANQR